MLYGRETCVINKKKRKELKPQKFGFGEKFLKWTEKVINEEDVLNKMMENSSLHHKKKRCRARMIGHILRNDGIFIKIIEGKINRTRYKGSPSNKVTNRN